ncbi:MAG: TIGR00341 family protein [Alphaproteobacteria bacterium]|nr:TIGR00341 family protein [Alphaproteobacteria bacterium]
MRLVEATFHKNSAKQVSEVVAAAEPVSYRLFEPDESGAQLLKAFFGRDDIQKFVDELQQACIADDIFRILILPVEATIPPLEEKKETDPDKQRRVALREEIFEDVAGGAALSADFFILTLASTMVAAIGLNENNVAAVIGAMVIAPLLGPILAFSFATALGDHRLLLRAARNAVLGLLAGTGASVLISLFLPINTASHELMSRAVVGLDSIALALAAGAAAALSIATGVSSALVGVMVAVALLPPAAAAGLFLGAGEFALAGRAALLLSVNVICIMLASQAVFAWKGIRPRTWLEKRAAHQTVRINLGVLALLLLAATAIIILTPSEILPDLPSSP